MSSQVSSIGRFKNDRRGAIAIIFALSIFTLCGATGLAIDASRAYNIAQKVNAALDAAALAAAKMLDQEGATDGQIKARAEAVLNAHLGALGVPGVTLGAPRVIPNRGASTVDIDVDISMPTAFAQVIGVPSVNFNKGTSVSYRSQRVELAMVLDVTGSMNDGGKLAAMKVAANDVIDALIDPANPGFVRISLVPYSATVNVGSYRDTASGGDSVDGCVMERLESPSRDTDDVPGFPRNFAVNGQLNAASNSRYACPPAVMLPLSSNATTLKNTINGYGAAGWTAGHIGLAWGWNTISDKWASIFTGDAAPGAHNPSRNIKAILLMTDGMFNTSYTAGTSDAEQTAEAVARTNALCGAIKLRQIRIFTVAFQAPAAAESLLQGCASPGDYYDANNNSQLRDAFRAVAESLLSLRVTN